MLDLDWGELLWAALTIGRPNTAYVFQHRDASVHEALFRVSLIRMALEQRPFNSILHRSDAFRSLDPTEKGAVSYFLGMSICKLFASRLLNTPWLLHLDVFHDQLSPAILGGRSRPDLVGQSATGAWHAFETKGRSSVPSAEDKRKAKAQAQRLVSVNGMPCTLHIGSFAFFRGDELEFYWRDPEPEEPEKLEPIPVETADQHWEHYYRPAVALASDSDDFLTAGRIEPGDSDERIDLKVEIHPKILGLLIEDQWAAARSLAFEMGQVFREEGFQADGLKVIVGPSWRGRFKRGQG